MAQDGGVPRGVRETALHELPQAAMDQMIPDEKHLAEQRPIVVRAEVLTGRACRTRTCVAVRLGDGHRPVRRVEQTARAIETHPTRVDDIDPGVHQDREVRRRGQAGDGDDLRGAQVLPNRSDRRHEFPRESFEFRSVCDEHAGDGFCGDQVGFPGDYGPIAGNGFVRDL